jgi:hypothetical protein
MARYKEVLENSKPSNRRCLVCGQVITNPDDYLGLGLLTDDRAHPLYQYNHLHIHRSCLRKWPKRSEVADFAARQLETGKWKGKAMERLLATLRLEVD